jgi:hypothetical protein
MSVATASHYPSVTANVVAGDHWLPPTLAVTVPPVAETQEPMLGIEVPGFDFYLETVLSDMHTTDDYRVVTVEAILEPGLVMLVTLKTQVADDAGNLQIKEVSINFDVTEHRPRPHFLAASLYAMLPLAGPIRVEIPTMRVDVTLNFSTPLREVSALLQSRQTYYGLMVIERATGLQFHIPEHISANDMNALAFTYHAIVERTFDWPAKFVEPLPLPANEESLAWLSSLQCAEPGGSVYKLQFGPDLTSRIIFGQTVSLGPGTIFISDAVFQNLEVARREIPKLDGHVVLVGVRSLSGIGKYHLPQAPRLPDSPWDKKIEACINLEDQLNKRLTDRYNELAASTLAGLTPEEIKTVTKRPTLDEDAHLIKEQD